MTVERAGNFVVNATEIALENATRTSQKEILTRLTNCFLTRGSWTC